MLFEYKKFIFNPLPISINLWWNIGFLISLNIIIQIVSGLLLTFFFRANWVNSFVDLIIFFRWQQWGWLIQLIHSNNASFIFFLLFCHIFRGLIINRFIKTFKVWNIGVVIFFIIIIEAFLGYVLPWGQISLWGATVITNFISALPIVGETMLILVRSNYMIDKDSLSRFFSLHYLIPFVILFLITIHIFFLHEKGSSNQISSKINLEKVSLIPFFLVKDIYIFFLLNFLIIFLIFIYPHILGDSENFIIGDYEKTPEKIQPEWYFLPSYAILRSFPEKLSGILAIIFSILIFSLISLKKFFDNSWFESNKIFFFFLVLVSFSFLLIEGANHASEDTVLRRRVLRFIYFFCLIYY